MQNEWVDIAPGYSINANGDVRNNYTDRLLKRSLLRGVEPAVSFRVDDRLVQRQVISYMAETWMEPHRHATFNTPMHLDGDRNNCHVSNLVFRPRWFVVAYNKDLEVRHDFWKSPFRVVETGEIFYSIYECARKFGALQIDVYNAMFEHREYGLFPTGYHLELL